MTVDQMSVNSSPSDWVDEKKPVEEDEVETNGHSLVANGAAALDDQDDSDEEELRCGLGVLSPNWMQIFASKQAFLVTFSITWVLQGMYYTYFVSVITTIEKLFQIQSKTIGIIMSATEIGQIGSSLLLTYYGGQGHRPKWIAWGMVLFAVSSFASSVPHFIFGDQLIHANEVLYSGLSHDTPQPNLCKANAELPAMGPSTVPRHPLQENPNPDIRNTFLMLQAANSNTTFENVDNGGCHDEMLQEQRTQSKITKVVLVIFFISLLGVGMGQTAVYTLGIPYIDDNVATRESPLYFGITIGVRILGPAMGFILGSLCTRLYANFSVDPQFTPSDPRWVGAWWLGLVIVSSLLLLSSFAMFSFPKRLKSYHGRPVKRRYVRSSKNPSLKDFPTAVKRLLKNDILMFRTASSVLHILPIAGVYTFLPKYLESQFLLPAHSANMISGIGGIMVMGVGIIVSGVFILRVKPNARFVAAWIAFTAVIYSIGMCVLMMIGCPMDDVAGLRQYEGPEFASTCAASCGCATERFSPVCGADGLTYFSACHAGCKNVTTKDGVIQKFLECQCIGSVNMTLPSSLLPEEESLLPSAHLASMSAHIGFCDLNCSNFVPYILLFSMFVFIHSTSEVGSMLLILRCVDPRDKAMALGLIQFAIGLFGNVPCTIVYGAVVDYACLIWDKACGKQGACWLYDRNLFRTLYHGTTGAIMLCAFLVDIVVWYKAGSINFVDEPPPEPTDELSPIKSRSETSV